MKKISCFSYKGGAGRSTLALNVVPYLADILHASPEHPFILIDMDVDSCGITYFFNLDDYKDIKDGISVQGLFGSLGYVPRDDTADTVQQHKFFRRLPRVGRWFNYPDDAILCLPAVPSGALGASNYDGKLTKVNDFIEECSDYECCGLLFDSAVGDQLTATWSNQAADTIMCCMRPTKQFREGTQRFFDKFDERIARGKRIIVIPNVVPTEALDIEDENGVNVYPEYAKSEILKSFEDNVKRGDNDYNLEMLEGDLFGVPKIDRFMWQEGILRSASKLTDTERFALSRYQKIAEIICKG